MIQRQGTNQEINHNENQLAQNNQQKPFSRLNNEQTNQRTKQKINQQSKQP